VTYAAPNSKMRNYLDKFCKPARDPRRYVYLSIMIIAATITTTMRMIGKGLLIMCRSMANLAPSGTRSMRHFAHFPGFG